MIRMLFIGLCLAASPAFGGGDLVVGNAGEVFRVGGRLHLRDLYDAPKIVFGNEIVPLIQQAFLASPLSALPLSEPERAMLLYKLTDIERMEPNLGLYLIEGSRFYEWRFVNEPLKLIDDPLVMELPPGSERLTAANRFYYTIRLQRGLWQEMNSETRVALIIHELLYSLINVQCDPETSYCAQSAVPVRELVAKAFSGSEGTVLRLTPDQRRQLNGLERIAFGWTGLARVSLQVLTIPPDDSPPQPVAGETTLLGYSAMARERVIQQTCQYVSMRSNIDVYATFPAVYVSDFRYRTSSGNQVGLCVAVRPDDRSASFRVRIKAVSVSECQAQLRDTLDAFYQGDPRACDLR